MIHFLSLKSMWGYSYSPCQVVEFHVKNNRGTLCNRQPIKKNSFWIHAEPLPKHFKPVTTFFIVFNVQFTLHFKSCDLHLNIMQLALKHAPNQPHQKKKKSSAPQRTTRLSSHRLLLLWFLYRPVSPGPPMVFSPLLSPLYFCLEMWKWSLCPMISPARSLSPGIKPPPEQAWTRTGKPCSLECREKATGTCPLCCLSQRNADLIVKHYYSYRGGGCRLSQSSRTEKWPTSFRVSYKMK